MRHPRFWFERFAVLALLALAAGYGSLYVVLPLWLQQQLVRIAGSALTVGAIRLEFPLKLIFSDVRLSEESSGAMLSSQTILVSPRWLSWPRNTVWLESLEISGLRVQCRRTKDGTLVWPTLQVFLGHRGTDAAGATPEGTAASRAYLPAGWRVVIGTMRVSDSVVEFVDQQPSQPFRGVLSQVSVVGGPVTVPFSAQRVSLAIQAQVVGVERLAAPAYCSGWIDAGVEQLDLSCQLQPLRLAAFQPYYQGPLRARVSNATLKATGHLTSKANALEGRIQVEIGSLSEADLSFFGRSVAEKKTVEGIDPALTGELQLSGPLDQPQAWNVQLAPGNEIVQRFLKPLMSRGIENIPVKVGTQVINVGLTPGSEADMSDIEAASKTVTDNLQIMAPQGAATEGAAPPEAAPPPAASAPEAQPVPEVVPSPEAAQPAAPPLLPPSATPSVNPTGSPSPMPPAPSAPVSEPGQAKPKPEEDTTSSDAVGAGPPHKPAAASPSSTPRSPASAPSPPSSQPVSKP